MTPQEVRELLDEASSDVTAAPRTDAAWSAGRRSLRRTRVAVTGAALAVVAGVGFGAAELVSSNQIPGLAPAPLTSQSEGGIPDEVVDGTLDPALADSVPVSTALGDARWDPTRAVPLSEDPVDRAGVAMQIAQFEGGDTRPFEIYVLGQEGRWRWVDVPASVLSRGAGTPSLAQRSLSSDGTRLVLGQKNEIVVVDLTSNATRTYPAPARGSSDTSADVVEWTPDGESIVFSQRDGAARLDPDTGEITPLRIAPSNGGGDAVTVLDDGSTVIYDIDEGGDLGRRLRTFDTNGDETNRRVLTDEENNELGHLNSAAGASERWATIREPSLSSPQADDRWGVLVVSSTGDPLSMLDVTSLDDSSEVRKILGWLDEDTVVFSVANAQDAGDSTVFTWEVGSDTVQRGPTYAYGSRHTNSFSLAGDYSSPVSD